MAKSRLTRELVEMLEQLDRQLNLLQEYSNRAFAEGHTEYFPEIAGKLRILLVHSRHNRALLFEVAQRLDIVPRVRIDGPPVRPPEGVPGPGDEITLDAFFDLQAATVATSEGQVSMTKRQLIRAWCEQLGGVHEDWAVDEALVNAVRSPININGMHPSAIELKNCARTALNTERQIVEFGRSTTKLGGNSPNQSL